MIVVMCVHIKSGAARAMLENIAGLKIFIVESRNLAIPALTDLFIALQKWFHPRPLLRWKAGNATNTSRAERLSNIR
jgi:hypothetical protein